MAAAINPQFFFLCLILCIYRDVFQLLVQKKSANKRFKQLHWRAVHVYFSATNTDGNRLDHRFYVFVRYIFRLIFSKSSPCCLTLNTHFMSLFSGLLHSFEFVGTIIWLLGLKQACSRVLIQNYTSLFKYSRLTIDTFASGKKSSNCNLFEEA